MKICELSMKIMSSNGFTSSRIILDPKANNVVIWDGKKAISWSSNVKTKHGWSNLKVRKLRKRHAYFGRHQTNKLRDINLLRIWQARTKLINFQNLILCVQCIL